LNPDITNSTLGKESPLRLHIRLTEAWIQNLADAKDLTIPVSDQYHLHHFRIKIQPGMLIIKGDLVDKPGSVIKLSCQPSWDAPNQKMILDSFEIKTKSKNLLVKSAGWVANKILHGKIDKQIEEQINDLYQSMREKIKTRPLSLPIKGQGLINLKANSINIIKLDLMEGSIEADFEVNGIFSIDLKE
jgi:hypothetical protein